MAKIATMLALGWGAFLAAMGWMPKTEGVTPAATPTPIKLEVKRMFDYREEKELLQTKPVGQVEILATGDIILGRSVNATMEKLGNFSYPFEKIAGYLKTGDITFVNLESPLIEGCKPTWEGMTFCGNPKGVIGLKMSGVTIATVANNHMGNYGEKGVVDTVNLLKSNNILVTGDGETPIITVKGTRFGFLGYNDVPGGENRTADMRNEIGEMRPKVDVLIVAIHWGIEYRTDPVDRQRELAHVAIDAGADLIIGNHPHWVEAVEMYKGKLITYAHGNFVFDQTWSRETQEGVLGRYVFAGKKLIDVGFYPIIVVGDYQPRWATVGESKVILQRMRTASEKLVK